MNQINLLFLNAMNPDDYNRFGFNFFKSKGFKVKVLILGLVYDKNFLLFNRDFEELTAENFIIFKDIKSLQKYFMENKDDIYIDYFIGNSSWNYRSLKIYHIINKFKLRLFLPISSFTPTQSKKNLSIFKFIKNTNFKKNFFLEFLSRKIIFFLRRLGFYKNIYEIIFSIQNNETYKFKNKFLLSAKVYNYSTTIQDLRLKSKSFNFKDENLRQNSPILYLDEAIGCHPDASSSNTINIDKYYKYHLKLLENFFFKISKLLHKNIVVASHPRNELINKEYGKINSFFRKEMIFKYETANLIKSCDICLAHSSTTVQLALLNQKKILILDMNNFHQGPSVTSKKFNLPIIDISKSYDDIEIKNKLFKQKVDNKLIQSYFGISKKFTYEYIYQYINEKKNLNTN